MRHIPPTFVPIPDAAERLGVPLAWLKREAEAGRVPAVRAGRRWLVHLDRTREALARLAAGDGVRDA
jgi:excisionase family DNA binding protein